MRIGAERRLAKVPLPIKKVVGQRPPMAMEKRTARRPPNSEVDLSSGPHCMPRAGDWRASLGGDGSWRGADGDAGGRRSAWGRSAAAGVVHRADDVFFWERRSAAPQEGMGGGFKARGRGLLRGIVGLMREGGPFGFFFLNSQGSFFGLIVPPHFVWDGSPL